MLVFKVVVVLIYLRNSDGYHPFEKEDIGTLPGDVQNWAVLIQNYILQVRSKLLHVSCKSTVRCSVHSDLI